MKYGRWWIVSIIQVAVIYIGCSLAINWWLLAENQALIYEGRRTFEANGLFLICLSATIGLMNAVMGMVKGWKKLETIVLLISPIVSILACPDDVQNLDARLFGIFVFMMNIIFIGLLFLVEEFRRA